MATKKPKPIKPGSPIWGENAGMYAAGEPIDKGAIFFRAGNPIGGPSESFRGISASSVPFFASVLGGGAPMSDWLVHSAGTSVYGAPGRAGADIH